MNYIFSPSPQPALPIIGNDSLFPVHRIYCVGQNYAEHALEMGHKNCDRQPFFFQKNPDNIFIETEFPYPTASEEVHWEIEMVVALKTGGTNISLKDAMNNVFGYGVGLDMTRRDLQRYAKQMGQPWEASKAFDKSAPCTALIDASQIGHPDAGAIWLDINGVRSQNSDISRMIWTIPEQITHLSSLFELRPGDLIFTGTPAGVGAIKRGDYLKGHVDGLPELNIKVV
ncbi:MAG: fumarylacetoacetate hydrolase family protein [Hyphomicrobiaceae bacterium]|nr:fumarylacetoacetate hydrolase family protein [Hyphomicrobiaceae bacterium]